VQLGVCVRDVAGNEVAELGRLAEATGYSHLYLPEAGQVDAGGRLGGRDPFVSLAGMFAATTTVVGGVGVAPTIFHRTAQLALRAATLEEQSGGRFHLGIGVSHRESAARFGVPFPASPLGEVRRALAELRDWRARLRFGSSFPLLVGALGPKMVALGTTDGDGLVLNWLTPTSARATVDAAVAAAAAAETARPLTVLYTRIGHPDTMRTDAVNYDNLVNYHQHFAGQGLHDADAIVAGTCLAMDDLGAVRARLEEYAESGLDVLCLYPHGLTPEERASLLTKLAPH
jgi:alkanesulfonate monooxygenase SsuD/methylene tetrahydromethanopterin reductase-like flavin-dependent oxidoreductase (luciferase family)